MSHPRWTQKWILLKAGQTMMMSCPMLLEPWAVTLSSSGPLRPQQA
jgi:hypothetical protein